MDREQNSQMQSTWVPGQDTQKSQKKLLRLYPFDQIIIHNKKLKPKNPYAPTTPPPLHKQPPALPPQLKKLKTKKSNSVEPPFFDDHHLLY